MAIPWIGKERKIASQWFGDKLRAGTEMFLSSTAVPKFCMTRLPDDKDTILGGLGDSNIASGLGREDVAGADGPDNHSGIHRG